jgi:N utilization substance protein A
VDIKSESEFAEVEEELGLEPEEDLTGRCHAILANGKRCPNAAVPGSRYCGLPAHQGLAETEGDHVQPPAPAAEAAPAEAEPEPAAEAEPEPAAVDGGPEPAAPAEATAAADGDTGEER